MNHFWGLLILIVLYFIVHLVQSTLNPTVSEVAQFGEVIKLNKW